MKLITDWSDKHQALEGRSSESIRSREQSEGRAGRRAGKTEAAPRRPAGQNKTVCYTVPQRPEAQTQNAVGKLLKQWKRLFQS